MASRLFSPVTLRRVSLPNRIVVSPMCQYSSQDGRANDWHLIHLGGLALSGAALLFIEATAVEPDGRITHSDLGLWNNETEQALVPVLDAIRRHSSTSVGIQLSHAGRKASCRVPWEGGTQLSMAEGGWETVAPSAVPQNDGERPPKALNVADLERIREAFAASAQRAVRLGIDGVELHAAHGYLLHEFLSPISNRRTDAYGGSLERRLRFPLEIFDAVRAAVPADMPIGVRVSATDWVDGGWDPDRTLALADALKSRGADWITASSGGISPRQQIALGTGYQVPFAEAIRRQTGLATIAVGLITEPDHAEAIVAGGQADLVALARGLLYDPRWGWHAAAALGATVDAPPQYWRAPPREHAGVFRRQPRSV